MRACRGRKAIPTQEWGLSTHCRAACPSLPRVHSTAQQPLSEAPRTWEQAAQAGSFCRLKRLPRCSPPHTGHSWELAPDLQPACACTVHTGQARIGMRQALHGPVASWAGEVR